MDDDDAGEVSASEVAAYAYCGTAWHLEHVIGHRAHVRAEEHRERGVAQHEAHGTRVRRVQRLGRPLLRVALVFFALAAALLVAALLVAMR